MNDQPRTLGNPASVVERMAGLELPHIVPLTALVRQIRIDKGPQAVVPFFDPADGGINAEVLFLLEAPGPNATNFISRNNPDQTAENFFRLNQEAGIDRKRTVIWNVVPWYIGRDDKSAIRPANRQDIESGRPYVRQLLQLLPSLRVILLLGVKARSSEKMLRDLAPAILLFKSRHPSPLSLNRLPNNRSELLGDLRTVANAMVTKSKLSNTGDDRHA